MKEKNLLFDTNVKFFFFFFCNVSIKMLNNGQNGLLCLNKLITCKRESLIIVSYLGTLWGWFHK